MPFDPAEKLGTEIPAIPHSQNQGPLCDFTQPPDFDMR